MREGYYGVPTAQQVDTKHGQDEETISEVLDRQAGEIADLQKSVDVLCERIAPVLRPAPPSTNGAFVGGDINTMPSLQRIRTRISVNTEQIQTTARRVNSVLAQVEL